MVEKNQPGQEFVCSACGARNIMMPTPAGSSLRLPPESERVFWQQSRRRTTAFVFVCVVCLLALLIWLLLHPSASHSPARQIKTAIFGRRVTEAVEQSASSTGEGRGDSQGQNGQGESGQQGRGQSSNDARSGGETDGSQASAGGEGNDAGGRGRGGDRHSGATANAPANEHNPDQSGSGLTAPPERSIGWLDRFFGTENPPGPFQAGQGGTGVGQPGSGNTNTSVTPPTDEPVATEITQAQPAPPIPLTDEPPPLSPRTTNRAAPGNATLNDNLEQLLRQHHAGSGDIRISLMWKNKNDLDLHVVDPRGEEIYFQNRRSRSGGLLDIDMNAAMPFRNPAVENVFWPERAAPPGVYKIYVNLYRKNDVVGETPFTVRILVRGRTSDFSGSIGPGQPKRLIHQFTLAPGN